MQTTITYNGVLIKDVCTEGIEYSVAKDSTGVDQIGVKCQCVFTGVVHLRVKDGATTTTGHTGVVVSSFPSGLADILGKLSKDRRTFILQTGKVTILEVRPGAIEPGQPQTPAPFDKMDIENGPIPSVQVTKITAGVSAHIRFTINFTIANCGANGDPSGLINFRFWMHEEHDCRTFLTTRTYVGRIRVAHKNIDPKKLARVVTVPPLERGYQRQIVRWDESSDGLHLDFSMQDRERIASPPFNKSLGVGAIDWSGQVTASTGNTFGFTGTINFDLRLTGPKTTSVADLIEIGLEVADSKARFFEAVAVFGNKKAAVFLESLAVTEQFAENDISISAVIRHTGDNNIIGGIMGVGGGPPILGKPMGDLKIGYDPEYFPPPVRTGGVGGLFLSVLQTPCKPAKMPNATTVATPKSTDVSFSAKAGEVESFDTLPTTGVDASPSELANMYLEFLLDSEIHIHTGRIALATGAAQDSDAETAALVSLHKACACREIRIDATRLNASPELPDWTKEFQDANGITCKLIGDAKICGSAPQISADNRKLLFRSQAQLVYLMSRPPRAGESIPVGCVPYRVCSFSDPSRVIPAVNFVDPDKILR